MRRCRRVVEWYGRFEKVLSTLNLKPTKLRFTCLCGQATWKYNVIVNNRVFLAPVDEISRMDLDPPDNLGLSKKNVQE